jgi:AraC-like DNA-binding protein
MMHVALKPVEELIFKSNLVLLAEYHCQPDDPLFANSGPANAHSIVFPQTSTRILREGGPTLEMPTVVTLYNVDVEYSSEMISPEGSHCSWMTLDPEVLLEIATSTGNCVVDSRRPFPVGHVSVDAALALHQRTLCRFARRFGDSDPLLIEDESIAIVERVLLGIRCNSRLRRTSADVIDRARVQLAARFAEPLSLGELAREVGVSPAYLSRAFRAATGQTLHMFREELRLRRSLDLLPDSRRDFTRVALDLGYSSHSHFSSRFRRYFGITPIDFVTGRRSRFPARAIR